MFSKVRKYKQQFIFYLQPIRTTGVLINNPFLYKMNTPYHSRSFPRLCWIIAAASIGISIAPAQEKLTDAQRQEAATWLEQAKNSFNTLSSSRLKKAEAAITAATASENAAMDLYLKAMKDSFTNTESMTSRILGASRGGGGRFFMMGGRGGAGNNRAQSPASAFNDWKKQMTGSNTKPGFKKALQIQLKWMLVCLKKAAAERQETELDVSSSAQSLLNEIGSNSKDIADQIFSVGGASNAIRQYLDISDFRSREIPDNIGDIGGIYERVILKPYIDKGDFENYRTQYQRRIFLESALVAASGDDKKTSEASAAKLRLKRQWEMEKACFNLGDEVRALNNMKKAISALQDPNDKNQALRDLEALLSPKTSNSDSPSSTTAGRNPRRGNRS